ncbi:MAG: hypothetical protein ACRD2P_15155 [Terriglobia bacterium]
MNYSRRFLLKVFVLAVPATCLAQEGSPGVAKGHSARFEGSLSFQTSAFWSPRINLNAGTVLVYGIGDTLPDRVASWRSHGYQTDVMTGIAWGRYENYLDGKFDGENHQDEAQTDRFDEKVRHGSGRGGAIYYMVPTKPYVRFITAGLKSAINAGAEAICLEEPEFWVRSGYSGAFKREWQAYYGEEWRPPDSSPDAQYRASKLKYYLYRRALSEAFDFVHGYAREKGRHVACYVASHSLPNYSQWRIVSPESSLEQVDCDGYIAQVWTGTSRTPNVCEGKRMERTFETAFLEYGAMLNLSRISGRPIWLLNDPVEDNPHHSWEDYRNNWECTMTASLLHADAWRYEVMPWPERVFGHQYPVREIPETQGGNDVASSLETGNGYPANAPVGRLATQAVEKTLIPPDYASELQVVIGALREMKQPSQAVRWERCGTQGVGVLISDTMMFQRGGGHASDPNLGSFYGLALPLLMRGLPIQPVQIEYAAGDGFLNSFRVLLLTYEGQKPPSASFHHALAKWVRAGGSLLIVDDDQDPYNPVREWWNTEPFAFSTPRLHLFEVLGLSGRATGMHRVGRGAVLWEALSPAALSYKKEGSRQVAAMAQAVVHAAGLSWRESRTLILRRGPFVIIGALEEADSGAPQPPLVGRFINLFDSNLPILKKVLLTPGQRVLLLDLDAFQTRGPRVLAAACRISNELATGHTLRFRADGIAGTKAIIRVAVPSAPRSIGIDGKQLSGLPFPIEEGTLKINFPNSVKGVEVSIAF